MYKSKTEDEMRRIFWTFLIVIVFLSAMIFALPASAAEQDFTGWTPIGSGAEFATITSGASADSPNRYYLTADITVNATIGGSGYNSTPTSNVVIDGNGHTITLSRSLFYRVNNFTMQNITLDGKIVWNSSPFQKSPISAGNGHSV